MEVLIGIVINVEDVSKVPGIIAKNVKGVLYLTIHALNFQSDVTHGNIYNVNSEYYLKCYTTDSTKVLRAQIDFRTYYLKFDAQD